jgi:hypothetical protein
MTTWSMPAIVVCLVVSVSGVAACTVTHATAPENIDRHRRPSLSATSNDVRSTAIDQAPSPTLVSGAVLLSNSSERSLRMVSVRTIATHHITVLKVYVFAPIPGTTSGPGIVYGRASDLGSDVGIKSLDEIPGARIPAHSPSIVSSKNDGAPYGLLIESALTRGSTVGSYAGLEITYRLGKKTETIRVRAGETLCSSTLLPNGSRDEDGKDPACIAEMAREHAAQQRIAVQS